MEIVPLKYPAELENRLRRSAVISNRKEIIKCYYTLYDLCKRDPHSPSQIKEVLIRFNMAVLNAYKLKREIHSELQVQKSMQDIAKAMSWGEIRAAVELFFRTLNFQAEEENENADLSPLIQKALQMVLFWRQMKRAELWYIRRSCTEVICIRRIFEQSV